ncbi:trihelix transcription factor DF1-like [Bidens hawaiensis]|uniref:trihelix transcription factor DF1-like n=1 Tax=Bidens hawaiensis TaxID=980011 RepID=UPI004049CFAB
MLQGIVNSSGGDVAGSAQPSEVSRAVAASAADLASSGFSEDEKGRVDDGSRNSGGNRWPRQETLALLKIRSDMDVVFRDSSLKGPLWDEVSRKLAELGYHRSAKKCKEKFENVYKYHKRTKEGRTSKADGKTYRFFDQLQALEGSPATASHHQQPPAPPVVSKPPQVVSPMASTQIQSIQPIMSNPNSNPTGVATVNMTVSQPNNVDPISVAAPAVAMPTPMNINHVGGFPFSQMNMSASTNSSSSSTSSEDEPPERRRNRKRKWKEFFGKLMKEVVEKQEELQSKFIDTLERRERDRMAREEAWRMQEMAKMKREHELLVQERQMVAAKDAAVISFLQKITEQNPNVAIPQISAMQLLHQQQQNLSPVPAPAPVLTPTPPPPQPPQIQQQQQQQRQQPSPPITAVSASAPAPASTPVQASVPVSVPALPPPVAKPLDNGGGGSGGDNILQPSPSRWPKAEINALINLRTTLDTKYQENGPKGPLWEEISAAMRKLGYNRNAKRCKEKWENINKYYKKVKESSKKRPEDSKTCPYFHQLDAIYRGKAASSGSNININTNITTTNNPGFPVKPETQMAPIMARPEQQWPLQATEQQQQQQHHQQQSKQTQNDDYDDDDEEEEEEEGGDYEIVPNNTSSMAAVE